jgi:hypothetical protein
LTLGAVSAAQADNGISTTINGFGTIGGTYTGDSAYTYVHNPSEFKATNSQFDLGLDSRIGVQANFSYGTDLSIIVEEEAKRRGSENFALGTEWAFIQYTPTADVKLRLGRVALATFLMSDSRDVGYAQPWFNAPNEMYGSEPFETLDGGQALWHVSLGQIGLDLKGAYGSTSQAEQADGANAGTVSARSAYNLAATLTYDNFLLRVAETSISIPLILPLGPTTVSYTDHDKFFSAGFQYDDGKAIALSEWAKRIENDVPLVNLPVDMSNEWYVAGGWRFGKLTPLLMYGKWDGGLSLLHPLETSATLSASLRYDIVRNVALKAQFSRPQVLNTTYFNTPNYASSERVNVISVGADFLF